MITRLKELVAIGLLGICHVGHACFYIDPYDASGNMFSSVIMNPSGTNHEIHFTYDASGRVLTETDAMGGVTSNSYDQYDNLISVTDPAGRTRTMTYDLAGRLITETDFVGNITSNTYDLADNVIHRTVHDVSAFCVQNSTFTFDSENRMISESNIWGQVTSNTYDSDGNLVRQELRAFDSTLLSTVSLSYNLDGKMTSKSVEMRGETRSEIYGYDDQTRLAVVEDQTGTTTIEYDGDTEKPKRVVSPLVTREYTYDARGRQTEIEETAGGSTRSTFYAMDTLGQVISQTDPLGRNTQYGYDALAQRIMTINALGDTNRFSYNFMGLISDLTDAKGNQTTFEYDLLGRLINKKYADNTSVNYQYNAVGNLAKRTDAKNQITAYAYDFQGRLVTNSYYPNSGSYPSSPSKTVSYSYDPWGRMTSWSVAGVGDPGFSGSYAYDETNRTRSITVDFGPFSKTITYAYNAWGQKISCQYPDGTEYRYAYDDENRLAGITIPNEGDISFSANQYGLPAFVMLPGGTAKSFGYDAMNRLVTNAVSDPADQAVMSRSYARNVMGNILGQQTEQGACEYQYDRIDQLTNSLAPHCTEGFVYDAMGNRLYSKYTGNETNGMEYSANNLNQYSEIISWTNDASRFTNNISYDLNGNQLIHYRQVTNGLTTNYFVWNIENRLAAITNQAGEIARYTYDLFGKRLSKAVNGITNFYMYSDEGLIAEMDSTGGVAVAYGYQPDSLWMNNPAWMRRGGQYYYFANDHLGAPQKLVAKNGSTVWSLVQDAFGRAIVSSNSTVVCNLRFSSQYFDAESGLHYNTHRYYDPEEGRYASPDPAEQTPGLYVFVQNNPVALIDPVGLWGSDVHYGSTKEWATEIVYMPEKGAEAIAYWDNKVDSDFDPVFHFTDAVWSWHFDRSNGGEDTRMVHRKQELAKAKLFCSWSNNKDNWKEAAKHVGYALHPLQDWVAHGDFNRRREAPYAALANFDRPKYAHNTLTKQVGRDYHSVDDPSLDSEGPNGRATFSVLKFATITSVGDRLYWANFNPGTQRIQMTEQETLNLMRDFMEYVHNKGKPCGECLKAFTNGQ